MRRATAFLSTVGLLSLAGLMVSAWWSRGGTSVRGSEGLLASPSIMATASPELARSEQRIEAGPREPEHEPAENEIRWFDGRPVRAVDVIQMRVTAYSPDARSCAPFDDGITASGYSVWTNGMKLVAADTDLLPFGSLVSVPGYDGGAVVPVLDRGARIKGRRLDVLLPTHRHARHWGVRNLAVTVWEYAD